VALNPRVQTKIDSLETLCVEQGRVHFGAYKNITISVWVGQANIPAVQAAQRATTEMASRHPNRHSAVSFVIDGLPGPTPEAMPLFSRLLGERNGRACTVIVLEGSGFWASGLRSMISNTHREGGRKSMLKVATSIDEVVDWLSEHHYDETGVGLTPDQLREALRHGRQFGQQAAAIR
jgi:hypothetical protein